MAEHVDAKAVLESTVEVATILAAAREIDRQRSLDLPFQALKPKAFIDVDASGIPSLRLVNMLSWLLTQAGLSSSGANEVASAVEDAAVILRELEPLHVVHGHDLERILGEILQALRYPRQQVSQLIRSTFEVAHIDEYPMLSAVVSFATAS